MDVSTAQGKHCRKCDRTLPFDAFQRSRKARDGLQYSCRECVAAYNRAWQQRNREKALEYRREWRRRNPERMRELTVRSLYGLEPEDYRALFESQHGACAICGKPETPGSRLHVDHDHTTGAVRGLLCNHCNVLIGMAGEDPATLRKAIAYLARTRE